MMMGSVSQERKEMKMRRGLAVSLLALFALALALPAAAQGGEGTKPAAAEGGEGKTLFASKCAMCHGADGVAKKMAAGSANLNDPEWQKNNAVEVIEKTITEGKGKMPKLEGKLTAEQIRAIASYVKTLK
jgi:mono/diheme cytochrome c family protein